MIYKGDIYMSYEEKMIIKGSIKRSIEYKKRYIEDCENAWDNLIGRVTIDFDHQLEFYGRQSIGRTLENINFLVKHGYKFESKDLAEIMTNLLEKTPEFLETFKPSIEKEDLLQLKKNVMEIKI